MSPGIKTHSPEPPRTSLGWSNWYLTIAKLAVGLLLALLLALIWLLHKSQAEEQRAALIADVLWLEQSLSFHLETNTGKIQQMAFDLPLEKGKPRLFLMRGGHLLKTNPEFHQILWLDANGHLTDALPNRNLPRWNDKEYSLQAFQETLERARKLGKPVFSEIYRVADSSQFEIHVPIFADGQYRGALVAVYSAPALLKHIVPWWFAEKYQVRLQDGNGLTLARKSAVLGEQESLSYALPLDPPGFGTTLQVTAYRNSSSAARVLIIATIIILAVAILGSLWAVRGLIRRRLSAEQALRAEHTFRKAMEDSLTVGMRARDLEGRVTYANPAFCQMVGYTEVELKAARPPMPYWAPEEMERTQALHDAVIEGRAPRDGFEIRFMRRDGKRFDALIYEAPLIDADGRHTGWMASVVDITDRKRAEELARQQQEKLQSTSRLVTMGEMASTLAHELNQPLAAITSYTAGCLNKIQSGQFTAEELTGALEKLGVQTQRAGQIVRRVHDFVRKSEPKLALCDLAEVIDDSVGFIEAEARNCNVRIVREIQGLRPELMADKVMLEQVLLNLMRNGIEAMRATQPTDRRLTIKLTHQRQQMEIRVIDCGSGLSPEVQEKLFTPFFTTKPEGMGMGLNICRSIIEFHQGRLWAENHPEGGTIFVITLPIDSP